MALKTRDDDDTNDFGVPSPLTQGENSCLLPKIFCSCMKLICSFYSNVVGLGQRTYRECERVVVTGDITGLRQDHVVTSVVTKVKKQLVSPRLDAAMTLVDLGERRDESGQPKKILLVHGGINAEGGLTKICWLWHSHKNEGCAYDANQ
ncbi:unnamed protein product [Allacma fusca]|uniref:Uncharacterized protein n=1 Tax=Allacma fusca TaxID=39272 RepID=A0A8J2LBC0_9HEXA|nr:unnamed protein product [Allacma fusca]